MSAQSQSSRSTSCSSRTTPATSLLTREAFEHDKVRNAPARRRPTASRRCDFLRREGEYATRRARTSILLDLNLPRKDGREVLAEIKADPDLRTIPVVVLTTSKAEEDVLRSYDLHANATSPSRSTSSTSSRSCGRSTTSSSPS